MFNPFFTEYKSEQSYLKNEIEINVRKPMKSKLFQIWQYFQKKMEKKFKVIEINN